MALLGGPAYLSLLLLSVVVSGLLVGVAVRYRDRRGALTFAALVACLFVWSLGEAVGFATNSLDVTESERGGARVEFQGVEPANGRETP